MESLSILLKTRQEQGTLTRVKVYRVVKILHLIFVDDVHIMSKASLEEWQRVKEILEQFFSATGLQVNDGKSTLHHLGVEEDLLTSLKTLFNYNFIDLSSGFKYLGYFIKVWRSSFEEWRWLIIKYEKRIKHWCNRWLTLGG
jgi:hypothetical protein